MWPKDDVYLTRREIHRRYNHSTPMKYGIYLQSRRRGRGKR